MLPFSDTTLIVLGTFVIHQSIFWITNAIIILLTYVIYPDRSLKYKIQKNASVNSQSVRRCAKSVLINQMFIGLPFLALISPLFIHLDMLWHIPFPPWYRIILELIGFVLATEIFFYYSHRMLHMKFVYEYVHKQHHQYRAPISLVCEYSHPIEFVISNMGPVVAGPLIFRSHLLTTWLWIVIAVLGTISHHSGYKLPGILGFGMANPAFHDFHHEKFIYNFGLLGVLDRLHGTDKAWRTTKSK